MATSRKGTEQVRDDYQALWSNMQQAQRQTDDTEVRAVCDQLLEALALRVRYLPGPMGVPGADGGANPARCAASARFAGHARAARHHAHTQCKPP